MAFSPDGRLLASASEDNSVRLWNPAAAGVQSILLGSRDGLWVACRVEAQRCWRYDDGTLLTRKNEKGLMRSIPLPPGFGPAKLVVEQLRHQGTEPEPSLSPGDGESAPVTLRVRNPGPGTAYWLAIHQERDTRDPLLFTSPPTLVQLGAGETWEATGSVSYLAAEQEPEGLEGQLQLRLEQARGDLITLEIPVRARAPELELVGEPQTIRDDVPTLAVRLRNAGAQALEEAEFRARISGIEKPLARVTEDSIPPGAEVALSFALPEDADVTEDSLLTLAARELSYPRHDWTFKDNSIRIQTPPWQLWVGLCALVLTLSVLLWYLRKCTHPLTRRLPAEPAALPRLRGVG